MAKINLKDKLRLTGSDLSDLTRFKVNNWALLLSIVSVTVTTWILVVIMMKMVSYTSESSISLIHNTSIFSSGNLIFLTVIIISAFMRSILYQFDWFKDASGDGATEAVIHFQKTYEVEKIDDHFFIRNYSGSPLLSAIKRVIITILTIGAGGSGGIEGPSIPVGQNTGNGVAKAFGVRDVIWLRTLEMCGVSAAITTLMHAPLFGAIFAMEMVFGCKFVYRLLTFSLVSSLLAFILSNHVLHTHALFPIPQHDIMYQPLEYLLVVLVTVIASIPSGIGLVVIFRNINSVFSGIPELMQAPIGALCCAVTAIVMFHYFQISPFHLLGVGEETIFQLFDGHISDPALTNWRILIAIVVLKIILTGFTIIAGGSAGLLIPAIFTGALSANALFLILHSLHVLPDYSGLHHLFMVVGVASSLICVLDLPIATVIFVAEIFGVSYIAPAILSITIARVLMRKFRPYLGL